LYLCSKEKEQKRVPVDLIYCHTVNFKDYEQLRFCAKTPIKVEVVDSIKSFT
jgi:hypothetical protein